MKENIVLQCTSPFIINVSGIHERRKTSRTFPFKAGHSGHVEPTQPRKPYEVQSLIVQKKYFRPCF